MDRRPVFLALGFLFVLALTVYAGFRVVLWLKPSLIAAANYVGG